MYIIYNQDGSIKKVKLTDFINQGSDGVNKIYVAIDGVSQSDYTVTVKWLLPNGEYVGPLVATPASEAIEDDDGESYDNAFEISIDAEETLYHGILKGSIVAERTNSTRLYTYPAKLVVNQTTYEPSGDINISEVAYDNLLNYIKTRTYNQEEVDAELALKEDKANKVTTLTPQSTDTQYPSAKAVYDLYKEVVEAAYGRTRALVANSAETFNAISGQIRFQNYGFYVVESKKTLVDRKAKFLNGDYYDYTTFNPSLKSTGLFVDFLNGTTGQYLILDRCEYLDKLGGEGNYFVAILLENLLEYLDIKTGDVLYLRDSDAPNRWFNTHYLYRLGDRKVVPNDIVISVDDTFAKVKDALNTGETSIKHVYLYNASSLLIDQNPTEITEAIKHGDYDNKVVRNSLFNSTANSVQLTVGVSYPNYSYLIIRDSDNYIFWVVRLDPTNNIRFLQRGTNLWIKENGIPDRWVLDATVFYAIEGI